VATASNGAGDIEQLLARLEQLVSEIETYDDEVKGSVFEFLDGIDILHRGALHRLGSALGSERVAELCRDEPTVAWLFDAYGVGVDERRAAEDVLEEVAGALRERGDHLELVDVDAGVVHVLLRTADGQAALVDDVEEALRRGMPGFVALHVEEADPGQGATSGPGLLRIEDRPPDWVRT
jgi:hypothetical protein